jgi:rod shape-determining protein MreD
MVFLFPFSFFHRTRAHMREIPYIILLIICLAFQAAFLGEMRVLGAAPNIFFIVTLYAALFAPKSHATLAAVMAGLACDVFAGGRLGVHALLFGLAAALLVYTRNKIFKEHPLSQAVLAFIALGAIEIVGSVAVKIQYPTTSAAALLSAGALSALWTAALAPFALALLVKFNRMMGFVERRSFSSGTP